MTALKTVSARIRGSKSDLEELGEDTEGLAESFSKYRGEIQGLTGFDIMKEGSSTEFKDIYDIFEGIAKVWDKLSGTSQSRVSEILGGTRQLQVISSIIGNWDDAAGAYADAMEAAGVATNANSLYMDTANAKMAQLKERGEEFASALFNTTAIKRVLDASSGLLGIFTKVIDKVGALPTIMTTVVGIMAAANHSLVPMFSASTMGASFKGIMSNLKNGTYGQPFTFSEQFSKNLKKDVDAIKSYSEAIKGSEQEGAALRNMSPTAVSYVTSHQDGSGFFGNADQFAQSQARAAVANMSMGKSFSNLSSIIKTYNNVTKEGIDLGNGMTMSQKEFADSVKVGWTSLGKYLSTVEGGKASWLGYAGSLVKTTAATIGLRAASMALNMALSMVVSLAIQGIIKGIDALAHAEENAIKKGQEAAKVITETQQNYEKTKSTVDGLKEKYIEFSKGVDLLGNNISLSQDQYNEWLEMNKQLAELFPELTTRYDENGNAIVILGTNAEEATQKIEELIEKEREAANTDISKNFSDVWKAAKIEDKKSGSSFYHDAEEKFIKGSQTKNQFGGASVRTISFDSQEEAELFLNRLKGAGIDFGNYYHRILKDLSNKFNLEINDQALWGYSEEQIHAAFNEIKEKVSTSQNEAYQTVIENLSSWLETSAEFEGLEAVLRPIMKTMLGNIDYRDFGEEEEGRLKSYILGLAETIQGLSPELKNAFESVFSPKTFEGSYSEYIAKLDKVMLDVGKKLGKSSLEMLELTGLTDVRQKYITDTNYLEKALGIDEESVKAAKDRMKELGDGYNEYVNGNVDYNKRPFIDAETMRKAGWTKFPEGYTATTYTQGYTKGSKEQLYVQVTPILEDGTVLTPEELEKYVGDLVGETQDEIRSSDKYNLVVNVSATESDGPYERALDAIKNQHLEIHDQLEQVDDVKSYISGLSKGEFDTLVNIMPKITIDKNGEMSIVEQLQDYVSSVTEGKTIELGGFMIPKKQIASYDTVAQKYRKLSKELKELRKNAKTAGSDLASGINKTQSKLNDTTSELAGIAAKYGMTVDTFVSELQNGMSEMNKHYAEFEAASGSDYVDSRSKYETLGGAMNKDIPDLMKRGWYNDAQVTTFLDTMLNARARTGDNYLDYDLLEKKIGETQFSISDFFKFDDDGNITTEGIKNFFDTVRATLGDEYAKIEDDGTYTFDSLGDKVYDIAKALGISTEAVEIFEEALKDITPNVKIQAVIDEIDTNPETFKKAKDKLVEQLGTKTLEKYNIGDLNIESMDSDDVANQIDNVQRLIKDKNMIVDGEVNLKVNGAEEARDLLISLIKRRQELSKPFPLRVDTSNLSGQTLEIMNSFKSLSTALFNVETEVQTTGKVSTETIAQLQGIAQTVKTIPDEKMVDLGIDKDSAFMASIDSLANMDLNADINTQEVEDDVNSILSQLHSIDDTTWSAAFDLDASQVEDFEGKKHDQQATVTYRLNKDPSLRNFENADHTIHASLTYHTKVVDDAGVRGNANVNGGTVTKKRNTGGNHGGGGGGGINRQTPTVTVLGNAFAKGSWGASHTSNSLVGELGPELVVRGNRFFTVGDRGAEMFRVHRGDIIFNHKQTDDILNHGRILNGQKRGSSFARGTTGYAYAVNADKIRFPSSYSSSSTSTTSNTSNTSSKKNYDSGNDTTQKVAEETKSAIEKFQDKFSDLVDWVERRLDYLAKKTEKYLDKADKAVERGNFAGAKNQYGNALGAIAEEIKANRLAATKYEKQGDKVMDAGYNEGLFYGTSSTTDALQKQARNSIEKKIKRGLLSSDAELTAMFANYSEGKKTVIDEATPFYEAAMEANDKASELIDQYIEVAEKWANIPLDKAQAKIDKLSDKTELNDLWIENAQGYREKNAFIDNDTVYARRERNYNNAAVTESSKAVRNALKKLPKGLLNAAEGGTKKVSTKGYTAGSDDWRAIVRYNKAIDAQRQAEQNAAVSTEEYTKKLRENTKAKFDNIKAEYESKESVKESYAALRKAEKESRDTKGYDQFGENARNAIKKERYWQRQNLSLQQEELSKLQANYRKNSKKMSAEDRRAAQEEINKLKQEIIETEGAVQELTDELNNIKLSKLESDMNGLTAAADKLQDDIDRKNTKGIKTTKKDYENLISNSKKQVTNLTSQNKELQKQQKGLSKTSKKYLELQDRIDQNNASIRQAQKSQVEWNNSIKMLPIEKIDDAIALIESRLGKYKSKLDLNKALDIDSTRGQYNEVWKQYALRLGEEEDKLAEYQANIGKAKKSKDGAFAGKTEEEWRAMYNDQVKNIRDLKGEMQEFKETMRDDLLWRNWNRALENIKEMRSELSSINSMLSDDMVFNSKGEMTDFGYTKIATLVKDYELAGEAVIKYAEGIRQLASEHKDWWTNADYEEERKEKIGELLGAMKDVQSVQSSLLNLYRSAAQEELDAITKVIEARSKALSAKKEYYDYDKNLKSQNKEIEALEAQIAALNGVAGAEARAKKARLEADLKEKKEALEDTVQEHQMEIAQKSLDELRETLTNSFNDGFKDMASDLHKIAEVVGAMGQTQWNTNTLVDLFKSLGLKDTDALFSYMKTHASGSRYINAKHLGLTQENGNEVIVTKYGMLTPLSRGDGVVPADLTKRLYDLAMNSDLYAGAGQTDSLVRFGNIKNEVIQNYDSLIHIDGSADAATVADLKQMQNDLLSMATKATTKQLYSGYLKAGGRRVS